MDTLTDKKRLKEKFRRTMKYWRVRYQQATEQERLNLYLFVFLVLSYAWWVLVVS